jgi:hypothetical protein
VTETPWVGMGLRGGRVQWCAACIATPASPLVCVFRIPVLAFSFTNILVLAKAAAARLHASCCASASTGAMSPHVKGGGHCEEGGGRGHCAERCVASLGCACHALSSTHTYTLSCQGPGPLPFLSSCYSLPVSAQDVHLLSRSQLELHYLGLHAPGGGVELATAGPMQLTQPFLLTVCCPDALVFPAGACAGA